MNCGIEVWCGTNMMRITGGVSQPDCARLSKKQPRRDQQNQAVLRALDQSSYRRWGTTYGLNGKQTMKELM